MELGSARFLQRTLKTIQSEQEERCQPWDLSVLFLHRFLRSDDRPWNEPSGFPSGFLPRKEVIQPHLPIRLPCYDFTPVIDLTFGGWLLAVTSPTSGAINSHGVTGGVYKARERIHRGMLIRDY